MSGDEARYERYRDLRSGVNANVVFNKETENWVFNVKASNIGYRDQRYTMDYSSKRVKVSFLFDSIPLNYGYDLKTPYVCTAGNCSLDLGMRGNIQNARGTARSGKRVDLVGVPQTVAQLQAGSIYNTHRQDVRHAVAPRHLRGRRAILGDRQPRPPARHHELRAARATSRGASGSRSTTSSRSRSWLTTGRPKSHGHRVGEPPGHVPGRLPALQVRARSPDADGGTTRSSHRLDYSQARDLLRPERLHQRATVPRSARWRWRRQHAEHVELDGHGEAAGPHHGERDLRHGRNRQDEELIAWTTNPVVANANMYATFPELAHLPRDIGRPCTSTTSPRR